MNLEIPEYSDRSLQRLMELQRQREIIERWVYCAGITTEALEQIQEALSDVDRELQALEAKRYMD
jgi:hypothetical protein